MANWVFNPFTDELDYAGSGGGGPSYIDGVADTAADLPVTQGNPPLDAVFVVKQGSGVWLINRKPAGLYCRIANNGDLDDWEYLGAFPEVNADGNWSLYNSADPTKELKFDVSGVSASTVRTLSAPDANGTIALTAQLTDTQIYTANDTWTKPAGAKLVHYLLIGGGGGGGAGRRGATSTTRFGGAGGGGAGLVIGWQDADRFDATESVTVGSSGAGGADSANDTDGAAGANGGDTTFNIFTAVGGNGGNGGTTALATGGAGTSFGLQLSGSEATTAAGGNSAAGGGNALTFGPTGGGGGASISNTNSASNTQGNGGTQGRTGINRTDGGLASAGRDGNTGNYYAGTGGSGNRATAGTFAGNRGGNAGLYGAGGGGGSGALNDAGGDNGGGDGAQGIVVITTYF